MQVERQSATTGRESRSYSFAFYLERWQPSSCLIQEEHLWYVSLSFSLFHQHALCTLHAACCFLPTQHLFDLIRSQEIDGCSIIVKITHRKSLSPLHLWKCPRAAAPALYHGGWRFLDGSHLWCLQGNYERKINARVLLLFTVHHTNCV